MTRAQHLPYNASLSDYEGQAADLLARLKSGDQDVGWRFKWEHPRFRGKTITDVNAATLDITDAQMVVAREYGFEDWPHLVSFTEAVPGNPSITEFETAVEAVLTGDIALLRSMLRANPELAQARSARRHHATLLHYIAANGVEGMRQKTPANAVEIARLLLDEGAEPDALADMYDAKCSTMSMLVSSTPPHEAGLQTALAETLLDYGAALNGPGTSWQSAALAALIFGFTDTAEALVERGAAVDTLPLAAGLGRLADVARLLPAADAGSRHAALALAAQLGQTDIVRLLLDAGEDPNRYNPDGYHSHATPLHQAISSNRDEVVHLLVERGARMDIADTIYQGSPLDWATYGERTALAEYLRSRGAVSAW